MTAVYRRKVKAAGDEPVILKTYRTDTEYLAAGGVYPSRWHRHVCARVADAIPAVIIMHTTPGEIVGFNEGERLTGTITGTNKFGAFVELEPGKDGLIHVSKLDPDPTKRIENVDDYVRRGDQAGGEVGLAARAAARHSAWLCPRAVQRIVRSSQIAEAIKRLYRHTCQVCGIRLVTPAGPYAEAAHIKALGVPHNGPDVIDNLLCLCANDHVLFDRGAIYIDPDHEVRQTADDASIGRLRMRSGHVPEGTYITYHREHFARRI
jgi:hypothetical protein